MDQLDDLLTGGRFGAATKAAVLDVYLASGGPVENVKVAQTGDGEQGHLAQLEHQCCRSLRRVHVAITGRIVQRRAPKRTANPDARC